MVTVQQSATPAPATAQTSTQAPAPGVPSADVCAANQTAYQAAVARRNVLRGQQETLHDERTLIAQRLRQGGAAEGADLNGLQQRIALYDKQLLEMVVKVAEADAAVAQAAGQACAIPPPPPPRPRTGPPEEFFMIAGMFIFFVMFPMAIAYSRRIWRRAGQVMKVPPELNDRLTRLEQSVESVAIEVERVGEGQRFVTNLFIEGGQQMLGAGAMNTLEIRERERVEAERRG